MNRTFLAFSCLALALASCHSKPQDQATDYNADTLAPEPIAEAPQALAEDYSAVENALASDSQLAQFKPVIDTLNSAGDRFVHAEYFLHDITGDGVPELWVKQGSCEADMEIWAFTNHNGTLQKILESYGGHSEFRTAANAVCRLSGRGGEANITVFSYGGGKVKEKSADYSTFNEEGNLEYIDGDKSVLGIYENGADIEFKPLK